MDQSQIIKDFLQEELLLFDEYLHNSVKSDNPRITEMVNYLFHSKGKRLRPILVLMIAKACGGIIPETYHGAVTVELLHSATLIHDDVIDKSEKRRGRRSVNAVYDNTQAVLIGDYLLSTALMESVKTNDLNIVRIISELGQNLSEGELDQFSLASEIIIDENAYFDVIEKKTASLMRASILIGAITGGAGSEMISKFSRLGTILGICFQIRDDIFDYYNSDVGKPTGNDIREGKITLPLIYALKNAPRDLSSEMLQIIESRDYSDENTSILLAFAKKYHGVTYAREKMDEYLAEAETIINDFMFNSEIKTLMNLFLSYLKERSY
ncbi:MAG: polyprenyl synthetase family protein [Bacteroidales bacterium]|jgi:octaprenyl-diphosphate synthase|nr:polyprenyl synthetase family protein [Bacteroidales bacterium]